MRWRSGVVLMVSRAAHQFTGKVCGGGSSGSCAVGLQCPGVGQV